MNTAMDALDRNVDAYAAGYEQAVARLVELAEALEDPYVRQKFMQASSLLRLMAPARPPAVGANLCGTSL